MRNTFRVPNFDQLFDVSGISCDKIVVVSIVGKSPYNLSGLKVKSIGRIIAPKENTDDQECVIDGSYDEENQIIYLHMTSPLDADLFVNEYSALKKKCETDRNCDDFLAVYDEVKSIFARYLLLIFHISHIVILSHPTCTVDTNYIQYFKAIDSLSQKLSDKMTELLKGVDTLSQEWVACGRFCTPRLIFYFERCPTNITNVKKLEHNLEDKIYFVLKKTRIISASGCSLFAIPMNNEFVYIEETVSTDDLGHMVRGLLLDCQPGGAMQLEVPYSSQPGGGKNFKKFLHVYIQQARTKGFDDTVTSGRHQHSQAAHFELPVLKQWIEATEVLYKLLSKPKLINALCTDSRFSEQRCLKVLPLAFARYLEGLPPHYSKGDHEARLAIALTLFRAQARGPVFERYASQLEMDCRAHWENGRQQCEVASLTGNPCKLPRHSSDREHMSGFIYKAVCDCGRKVGAREDPYNVKQANYTFYHQISKECQCSKLERIQFPQQTKASKASISETDESSSISSDRSGEDAEKEHSSVPDNAPTMLTLSTAPGMLPIYSSWSLVCLGASSLYSHNLGLSESHQPGFLSSTNYLLPWDVLVFSKSKQTWPHVNKYTTRGRRGRSTGSLPQFTVKVFIGVEYECSSGHRFMLSSPERMLKAMPGSIVKDTGHKIAESDMPLYFPCACRSGNLAQLMRLHVVTPKAPVHCTLDPKVQPGPGAPIFTPTTEGPTKLTQSAYWIMRFPYVYISEKEHYNANGAARLLQGVFGVTEMDQ